YFLGCCFRQTARWGETAGRAFWKSSRALFTQFRFFPDGFSWSWGTFPLETASGRSLWKREWERDWRDFGSGFTFPADIRFAADCQFLFVPRNGSVEILDVKTGETINILKPSHLGERHIEFTKDGRFYSLRELVEQEPGFLQKLLGDWWPVSSKEGDMT